jgi:hypothetical protein
MGQAAVKIREAQKLTAGAKARKYFRRLNGTAEVVPSQSVLASFARWTAEGGPSLRGRGNAGSALEWLHGERLYLRGLRGMERDHGG